MAIGVSRNPLSMDLQLLPVEQIIGTEPTNPLTPSMAKSDVQGRPYPAVFLVNDSEPLVSGRVCLQYIRRRVSRSIVYYDGFPVGNTLVQKAAEGLREVLSLIIGGDKDTEKGGLFHGSPRGAGPHLSGRPGVSS